MKKDISVNYEFNMEYDPNSDIFKQTLKDYNECGDKYADEEDMLKHIAWYITKFGADELIECVGYVAIDGEPQGEPYCGVNITSGYDEPYIY